MRLLLWLALCAPLAGCGGRGSPAVVAVPPRVVAADRTHEYRSVSSPAESVPAAARTPEATVRAFAETYINWDAGSIVGHLRLLALGSVGQARSEMGLAAARAAGDYELKRGGVANQGTVEAIAPVPEQPDRYLVVTFERTTATNTTAYRGLRPAWHLTLATVQPLRGGWVVSDWWPES